MAAKIHYADLWGLREIYEENAQGERELSGGKYHWLWQHDVSTTEWKTIEPQSSFYLFVPQDIELLSEYEQGWKITEAIPVNVLGFQTHRDQFAIDFDELTLRKRIAALRNAAISDEELREHFKLGSWNISRARAKIRDDKNWEAAFVN